VIPLMATCHPNRRAVAGGQCRSCTQVAGFVGLEPGILRRQLNVEQRVVFSTPDECPKCHKPNTLVRQGPWIHCSGFLAGCGWDAVLAADPIAPRAPRQRPRLSPNRRRYAHG
jgi:hypothetical protein